MSKTYRIRVTGRVQGVGFRPYVCLLASRMGLVGEVYNDQEGVLIFLNGSASQVEAFYDQLITEPPPLSRIMAHDLKPVPHRAYFDFSIGRSANEGLPNLQLTPDFGICPDCRSELLDSNNRRYGYPFTSCVNCGPRWAITRSFPFERAHTSIDAFPMCPACLQEYSDQTNRRFHSQTNSCPDCGVSLALTDAKGTVLGTTSPELFRQAADRIRAGEILAVKNSAGYLLCCDATHAQAVKRLRERKQRPSKPFALLYPDMERLLKDLNPSLKEQELLLSVERPIVIIPFNRSPKGLAVDAIAPGLRQLGVMLPYSGMLELLASFLDRPIVATSGNIHGSPVLYDQEQALELLGGVSDYFIQHDLEIEHPQDDSVVRLCPLSQDTIFIRRSRGFAPNLGGLKSQSDKTVLAMGSQLKSTIALLPNDYLYVSQYLGNLDNYDVYQRYMRSSHALLDIFGQQPDLVLVDAHPEYLSTRYGQELAAIHGAEIHQVQHHEAHFASVLGENGLFDHGRPVLGVVWDGTGYGSDGMIWGGEFFIWDDKKMSRIAHLDYYHWLAGDKMALEPRISLLSLSVDELLNEVSQKFSGEELRIYRTLKQNNKLKTSSMGRLFDAVASLLGICDKNTYEGEAAMRLEGLARGWDEDKCMAYHAKGTMGHLDPAKLLRCLKSAKDAGMEIRQLASNFLYTLAKSILEVASAQGVRDICMSGGVFQNAVLVDMVKELGKGRYNLYFHRELSPNDENISHGQLMYYLHFLQ